MANGGYTIIDFENKDFIIGTPQKVQGVYNQIDKNYSKPVILWGLTINGSAKKALFLNFMKKGDDYTTTEGSYIFTISSNDNVLIEEIKDMTIEDLLPVLDLQGNVFDNYDHITIPGAYNKVRKGGVFLVKNFSLRSSIYPTNTTQSETAIVNFNIVPSGTTNAVVIGTFQLIVLTGSSASTKMKIYNVGIRIMSNDWVEMFNIEEQLN